MRVALLSGGSGKRLWPLSNDLRSKQFIKFFVNQAGEYESMLQRVWNQIQSIKFTSNPYIISNKSQVEMIQGQLDRDYFELVIEPERRDTFSAISLMASYLYSFIGAELDETIIVLPVDSFAEQSFFHHIESLGEVLTALNTDLVLLGVKPTYPSEKYGYIIPILNEENDKNKYYKVQSFHEKPSKEEAAALIEKSALWNCGVFAFRLGFMIDLLIDRGLPFQYEEVVKQYSRFPKTSFDYEVVERTENIVVVPYHGTWKDLGTWNTLTEEIHTSLIGKGIVTDDSKNTHVINELDIPIAVIGASNLVIAASPDGILVSDKESSPRIKDIIKNNDQRPMYEERRWGRYRVLDHLKYENGQEVLTKRICIQEGKNLSYQYHNNRREVWTIISGQGEMIQDGHYLKISAGDVIIVPANSKHSLKAISDMEIVEVQSGIELTEEDIVRLAMDWEEILQFV